MGLKTKTNIGLAETKWPVCEVSNSWGRKRVLSWQGFVKQGRFMLVLKERGSYELRE